jgi:hypothetical protein
LGLIDRLKKKAFSFTPYHDMSAHCFILLKSLIWGSFSIKATGMLSKCSYFWSALPGVLVDLLFMHITYYLFMLPWLGPHDFRPHLLFVVRCIPTSCILYIFSGHMAPHIIVSFKWLGTERVHWNLHILVECICELHSHTVLYIEDLHGSICSYHGMPLCSRPSTNT